MIGTGLAKSSTWERLGKAMDYYEGCGYTPVDLPWAVGRYSSTLTCPDEHRIIKSDLGDLVGSAEQSFLEQVYRGLGPGEYVACTPCFRNEPVTDVLHRKTFMKVELFTVSTRPLKSDDLVARARRFFSYYVCDSDLEVIDTSEGKDIELNGVEIGSYGVRHLSNLNLWCAYGTGLAEPRFAQAWARRTV